MNAIFSLLDISPISLHSLAKSQKLNYGQNKLEEIRTVVHNNMEQALGVTLPQYNQDVSEKIEALDGIVGSLKSKINSSNHQEKLQLLTLAPSSWTTAKIALEFGVSVRAVKTARKLKKHCRHSRYPSAETRQKIGGRYDTPRY